MRVIAGSARGIPLKTLEGKNTRPTLDRVKESLFSILLPWLEDGIVADFFSGSGSLCIEALSRGAKKAYLIEHHPAAVKIIRENLQRTKVGERAVILQTDFRAGASQLAAASVKADILFVDPPHAGEMATQALTLIDDLHILEKSGIIVVEHHTDREMPPQVGSLEKTRTKKFGNTTLSFYQRSDESE